MSEPGLRAALSLSAARRLALSCAGSALAAASPGAVRGPNWLRVSPLCDLEAAELDQKRPGKDQEDDRVGEHCLVLARTRDIWSSLPKPSLFSKDLAPRPQPHAWKGSRSQAS